MVRNYLEKIKMLLRKRGVLWLGHADAKNDPSRLWEEYMLLRNVFQVTGRPGRPALEQIMHVKEGDFIFLYRNAGNGESAVIAYSQVWRAALEKPVQYDKPDGVDQLRNYVEVEPWSRIEPVFYRDLCNATGVDLSHYIRKTLSQFDAAMEGKIFDLIASAKRIR
jgi:hypothetical protein